MKNTLLITALFCAATFAQAQTSIKEANMPSANPTNAEMYAPLPPVVVPGKTFSSAPSDAIVLFDGKNLDEWVSEKDQSPAQWKIDGDVLVRMLLHKKVQ